MPITCDHDIGISHTRDTPNLTELLTPPAPDWRNKLNDPHKTTAHRRRRHRQSHGVYVRQKTTTNKQKHMLFGFFFFFFLKI
jgi:hypothetical protein